MTVDYDLIILGGSPAGRYAAAQAHHAGARVALIEPPTSTLDNTLFHHFLVQLNPQLRSDLERSHWHQTPQVPVYSERKWDWQKILRSAEISAETLTHSSLNPYSLPRLATVGVEVIVAAGSFCRQPRLGFAVADRLLRARSYLLAIASQATLPAIEGIVTVPVTCIDALTPQIWPTLPESLMILGNDPRGLVLAQVLNRLGTQVTLLTSHPHVLFGEDAATAFGLQAQLEAEGVTVLTQTQIQQVQQQGDRIVLTTNQTAASCRTIETATLVLATRPQLCCDSLHLEAAGVKWQPDRIPVNRKLQTTQPRIYACGESLGGFTTTAIDRYEVDVALHNALFWPKRSVNYRSIPWTVMTDPGFVRIGLTETQAKQQCKQVLVAQQSFKSLERAQQLDDTSGFLQLIAQPNGEILGAQAIGPEVHEWMGSIALAMQHQLKLSELSQSIALAPSFSELIQQTVQQLQRQCRPDWQQELSAAWFDWRRSR